MRKAVRKETFRKTFHSFVGVTIVSSSFHRPSRVLIKNLSIACARELKSQKVRENNHVHVILDSTAIVHASRVKPFTDSITNEMGIDETDPSWSELYIYFIV